MKHLKIYEEFEYMWDNPDYFKNFIIDSIIVLSTPSAV
jgi:hypothetical protein